MIDPVNLNFIQDYNVQYELTSDRANQHVAESNAALKALRDKINEMLSGVEDVIIARSVHFDNSGLQWGVHQDVQRALYEVIERCGDYDLLYNSASAERDHANIDHTGIAGVPNISSSNIDELTGGGNTTLHRHDTMYLTKTELSNLGVSSSSKRISIEYDSGWVACNANGTIQLTHNMGSRPDGIILMVSNESSGDNYRHGIVPGYYNGSGVYIGIAVRIGDTNISLTSGDLIYSDILENITNGYIKVLAYKLK